jgi:hypothetical protein
MGVFMSRIFSTTIFDFFGLFDFTFNPGPFTIKEHVLISVIAASGGEFSHSLSHSESTLWDR